MVDGEQNPPRHDPDGGPDQATSLVAPTEAAQRALAEARERRRRPAASHPLEIGGREGPDPVRFGDWEIKGLASDF